MRKLILLLSLLTLISTFAFASIPHLMSYQGKAADKSGAPLNGNYNLTFRIYNTETGGTSKWSETQAAIPISNGIFQVQLGSVTALNLPFDEPYWISLEINTDGEMSPRTKLASVPYAYKAESLAEPQFIPFYKKGFEIEGADFNSVKITPGVMDVAGKMLTSTVYSNAIQLAYLDGTTNRDWIHGQKTNNSTAYIYAYNNNGQIAFKFSDESPDLSDHSGNAVQKPFLYQKYPDSADGIYYRYVGNVTVNSIGVISGITSQGKHEPSSMFSTFGGNGSQGPVTVNSPMNFSTIDDTNSPGVAQFTDFIVNNGQALTVDTGFAYIGVAGTCVIHGTITVSPAPLILSSWVGAPGAASKAANNGGSLFALGGGGGGGGSSSDLGWWGENGEWAGGTSGSGGHSVADNGDSGGSIPSNKALALTGGLGDNSSHIRHFNPSFLGGGGRGGRAGHGGWGSAALGGGVLYIECDTLVFDGILTANGADGASPPGTRYGTGGGGGGGTIIIRARVINTNTGSITVNGGVAQNPLDSSGKGGAGGAGFKDITTN